VAREQGWGRLALFTSSSGSRRGGPQCAAVKPRPAPAPRAARRARRSEQERFRRRDLLHVLRNRREQIQQSLKRTAQTADRDALMSGAGGSGGGGRETEATAALDTRGLLQLQEQVMQQQDRELEQMERTIGSTKVWVWGGGGG
jgi:hypothetical protein